MIAPFLRWCINTWISVTGRAVSYEAYPWLKGPMSKGLDIGDRYYDEVARQEGLTVSHTSTEGLIVSFDDVVDGAANAGKKVSQKVTDFYERTAAYKLEVWSQWYAPIAFFARVLIRSLSTKMNQLNIPLQPLETSHGMSNEVIQLKDAEGGVRYACWLRKSILTGRVVYAGFYSGIHIEGAPFVRVVFPLPGGNVTVLLKVVVNDDGSVELVSRGKGMGDAGYYRVQHSAAGKVKVRYIPIKERIHVYEDAFGVLRTDHIFWFRKYKFLHLHYKIIPAGSGNA